MCYIQLIALKHCISVIPAIVYTPERLPVQSVRSLRQRGSLWDFAVTRDWEPIYLAADI